jgi:hypothetical protein
MYKVAKVAKVSDTNDIKFSNYHTKPECLLVNSGKACQGQTRLPFVKKVL